MANLIKAFGPQFNSFVPHLIPSLLGTIKEANGNALAYESVEEQYAHLLENDDAEDEKEDGFDGKMLVNIHTSVVDMEKAGLAALCAAIGFTNGACEPYTADILETVEQCFCSWMSNIRSAAAECLLPLVSWAAVEPSSAKQRLRSNAVDEESKAPSTELQCRRSCIRNHYCTSGDPQHQQASVIRSRGGLTRRLSASPGAVQHVQVPASPGLAAGGARRWGHCDTGAHTRGGDGGREPVYHSVAGGHGEGQRRLGGFGHQGHL